MSRENGPVAQVCWNVVEHAEQMQQVRFCQQLSLSTATTRRRETVGEVEVEEEIAQCWQVRLCVTPPYRTLAAQFKDTDGEMIPAIGADERFSELACGCE